MSILKRLRSGTVSEKKLFGVVAGRRLSGKSTLAGTLPGKTLMLQAAVLESGSKSAEQLAKENGNELAVVNFSSIAELAEVLLELKTDTEFDNVYVDSLSAVTDMKYNEADIQRLLKKDNWGAFREIGKAANDILLLSKSLTYADQAAKPKNVFMTAAINIKTDANGNIVDVALETKGQKALSDVTKLGEAVVTAVQVPTETGFERKLLTRSVDHFPARVDAILDSKNPGMIPADLSQLLKLVQS